MQEKISLNHNNLLDYIMQENFDTRKALGFILIITMPNRMVNVDH